jgi:hypothetical protein
VGKITIHTKRKLPLLELLDKLTKEYIIASTRSKIYPAPRDKDYWKKVMDLKKVKIKDIANRNFVPHIFDDYELKCLYQHKVLGVRGFPNFDYQSQFEYDKLYKFDLKNYYHPNSEVRINIEKESIIFANIIKFEEESSQVLVQHKEDGCEELYHMDIVTRIL